MSKYNIKTIDKLLNDYLEETKETVEVFSENTGIDVGFVKQMLSGKRYPSTSKDNPIIVEKIASYTGDTFDDVFASALNSKAKIEGEQKRQMEKRRRELEKESEERRILEEKAQAEREEYGKTLSISTGYEITLIKEKEPIIMYGKYNIFELGGGAFLKYNKNLYNVAYITKITEFEYVVDKDGNKVNDYTISNGNIVRKPTIIRC